MCVHSPHSALRTSTPGNIDQVIQACATHIVIQIHLPTNPQTHRLGLTLMIYASRAEKNRSDPGSAHTQLQYTHLIPLTVRLSSHSSESLFPAIHLINTAHLPSIHFYLAVSVFTHLSFPSFPKTCLFFTTFPLGLQPHIHYICLCIFLSRSSVPLPS